MMKYIRLFALLLIGVNANAEQPADGKLLFTTRCAGCHNVNKQMTGPALAGVEERRSLAWIVKFVNASQAMVKSGDKDAVALYEKFNKVAMPDHPDIDEKQVTMILDYIKSQVKTTSDKAPFAKPGHLRPDYKPVTNPWFYFAYVSMVLVLAGVLVLFVRVKMIEREGLS